jgi:hypothetical protein
MQDHALYQNTKNTSLTLTVPLHGTKLNTMTCTKLPWMLNDINPFWASAHGAKEDGHVNGHDRLVKWRVMGHLRARDVLFDGVVDYSHVEELVDACF